MARSRALCLTSTLGCGNTEKTSRSSPRATTPRATRPLPSIEEDAAAAFAALQAKRSDLEPAVAGGGYDFRVAIRGGTWTSRHLGVPFENVRGAACGAGANEGTASREAAHSCTASMTIGSPSPWRAFGARASKRGMTPTSKPATSTTSSRRMTWRLQVLAPVSSMRHWPGRQRITPAGRGGQRLPALHRCECEPGSENDALAEAVRARSRMRVGCAPERVMESEI